MHKTKFKAFERNRARKGSQASFSVRNRGATIASSGINTSRNAFRKVTDFEEQTKGYGDGGSVLQRRRDTFVHDSCSNAANEVHHTPAEAANYLALPIEASKATNYTAVKVPRMINIVD